MSPCNIPFLTALESLQRFTLNFVWMFLGWTPTKFVIIICYPYFHGIMGNLCSPILKKYSIKPLTRNHSYMYFVWSLGDQVSSLFKLYYFDKPSLLNTFSTFLIPLHTDFHEI